MEDEGAETVVGVMFGLSFALIFVLVGDLFLSRSFSLLATSFLTPLKALNNVVDPFDNADPIASRPVAIC